jgi:hypothetical protein
MNKGCPKIKSALILKHVHKAQLAVKKGQFQETGETGFCLRYFSGERPNRFLKRWLKCVLFSKPLSKEISVIGLAVLTRSL